MKVKSVTFGKTFNDGNYESTRIDFSAEVDPGDDEMEVFEDLVDLCYDARKKQILATKIDLIKKPEVGMRVKCLDKTCCHGMDDGDKGEISFVTLRGSIGVLHACGKIYYHCKECLEAIVSHKAKSTW